MPSQESKFGSDLAHHSGYMSRETLRLIDYCPHCGGPTVLKSGMPDFVRLSMNSHLVEIGTNCERCELFLALGGK